MVQNQHIVPKFYLENFTDGSTGLLQMFNRRSGSWVECAPAVALKMKDFYMAHEDDSLERLLSRIEAEAAPIIRGRIIPGEDIDDDDRMILAYFFSSLRVRSPSAVDLGRQIHMAGVRAVCKELADPDKFASAKADFEKSTGEDLGDDIDHTMFEPGNFTARFRVEVDKGAILSPLFQLVPLLAEIIFNMSWSLLRSKDDHIFITTDHPVATYDPKNPPSVYEYGPGLADANMLCPISSGVFFRAGWDGPSYSQYQASRDDVERLNRIMLLNVRRFLIASRRSFPGEDGLTALEGLDLDSGDDEDSVGEADGGVSQ